MFRKNITSRPPGDHWQLLVPQSHRHETFVHLHEHSTGGHLGETRTLHKMKQAFYWPRMRDDVQRMCRSCDKCTARKPTLKKTRAPLKQYVVGEPMERMAIDVIGPLPKTKKGNKYVVVIADYFTKWTEAFALPNQEAETVARVLVEEVVCRLGVPRQLHSDKGTNFESQIFQEMCALLNIEKTRTTSRRPQSDGMVERFNRSLETMLTMYVEQRQTKWDEHLPYVMLAYRSSVHDSTGFSPNMMMLGRETSLPLQVVVGTPLEDVLNPSRADYVDQLQDKLEGAHAMARENLQKSAVHQKRNYDHKASSSVQLFQVGQAVWYWNSFVGKGKCKKFTSPWKGPYVVVQKIDDVRYKIQKNRKTQGFVVHVDALKKYEGSEKPTWFRDEHIE